MPARHVIVRPRPALGSPVAPPYKAAFSGLALPLVLVYQLALGNGSRSTIRACRMSQAFARPGVSLAAVRYHGRSIPTAPFSAVSGAVPPLLLPVPGRLSRLASAGEAWLYLGGQPPVRYQNNE